MEVAAGFYGAGFWMQNPTLNFALFEKNKTPSGMVWVAGDTFSLSMPGLDGLLEVTLASYWIDKFEVTNREFKKFVDADGYTTRRFWREKFIKAGTPATSEIAPVSNFGGKGLAAAGSYAGLGPYGTYDLAGNAKEWCWNASEQDKRYVLGGAWNEPAYMFTDPDAQSPFVRHAEYGFRLVRTEVGCSDIGGFTRRRRRERTHNGKERRWKRCSRNSRMRSGPWLILFLILVAWTLGQTELRLRVAATRDPSRSFPECRKIAFALRTNTPSIVSRRPHTRVHWRPSES